MNRVIQIFLIGTVLLFPIVFFWIYTKSIENKANKIIKRYSDEFSEIYSDLNVWVKDYDVFKQKKSFTVDPYQKLYSLNYCDLILNDKNIVVIGKIKILGKNKALIPIIFKFEKKETSTESKFVVIKKIRELGNDLEIEFVDNNYTETMTLIIKKPDVELIQKIKNRATPLLDK